MEKTWTQSGKIKDWLVEERPREKCLQLGIASLTNSELLALIFGNGTKNQSAVDLGRNLLQQTKDLLQLSQCEYEVLVSVPGIGRAKALQLLAVFELGRRKNLQNTSPVVFKGAADVAQFMCHSLADLPHEEFHVLFLNRKNKLLKHKRHSVGGLHATSVDPRLIIREALILRATALILLHNHPSEDTTPSLQDKTITETLNKATKLLEINLLDHIIIAGSGYYSFADNGLL